MDMSNSTNDGAKAVLCSWKFRGDVMEMRLMAVWSASADRLDSQGKVLTGTMVWGSDFCTTRSSEPETWTQCLTRSMSASLFPVKGIAHILYIPAQNSTSCSWDNTSAAAYRNPTAGQKILYRRHFKMGGCQESHSHIFLPHIFRQLQNSPYWKMSQTHGFHFSYTKTIHSTLLWQNCHKQHVRAHLKNDYKEYMTQVQTPLYQMSQAWDLFKHQILLYCSPSSMKYIWAEKLLRWKIVCIRKADY